jgi:simple sugar transport system ATP-binding protein
MSMDAHASEPSALRLKDITKRFDALAALDGVTADFLPGRVHGVLGENGAGKSTLMRIAAGLLSPDDGRIVTPDADVAAWSPAESARAGIATVHQHFMLVPGLTVAENCTLGRRSLSQWSARRHARTLLHEIGKRTGLQVDPDARIEMLSVGERQRVEILRALCTARRMLILDEPTAVLAPHEIEQFFQAIERLKQGGLAVAFISHKLMEVERICDDLTILRRGRCVYSGRAGDLTQAEMARHMVGTDPGSLEHRPGPAAGAERVLRVCDVSTRGGVSRRAVHDVNLAVGRGEIVGIAGVEGNGQDVLASILVGLTFPTSGTIELAGRMITHEPARTRAALGLAHIAEDRLQQALVPGMNVAENLSLRGYRLPRLSRHGFLRWPAVRHRAVDLVREFDVRAPGVDAPIEQLRGGNQQKVVLARELSGSPSLILAHNSVRGLDVAATRFVFNALLAQRARGAGILLIHSDLDELLALSDRVFVMYAGRCIPTDWPGCTREHIGRLMLGARS